MPSSNPSNDPDRPSNLFEAILADSSDEVARQAKNEALGRKPGPAVRRRLAEQGVPERVLGLSPLLFAAALGRAEAVAALLAAGAKPRQSRADPTAPGGRLDALSLAAEGGHPMVVRHLLDAGYGRWRTLRKMLDLDAPAMVTLIEGGARVDGQADEDGPSVLMAAAADDDVETVRALLAAGADPAVGDSHDGGHALSYAAKSGARRAFALLAAEAPRERFDDAVDRRRGALEGIWRVMAARAPAGYRVPSFADRATWLEPGAGLAGEPTLLVALDRAVPVLPSLGSTTPFDEEVARLLRGRADVDARDAYGRTALEATRLRAARDLRRARDRFEALADRLASAGGTDGAEADRDLVLALHVRDENAAREALTAGARPEARDHDGTPALHLAIRHRLVRAVEALLGAGASPDVRSRDVYGKPALFVALETGDAEYVERLVVHGADVDAPLDPDAPWQTPQAMLIYGGWTGLLAALGR